MKKVLDKNESVKTLHIIIGIVLSITVLLALAVAWCTDGSLTLFCLVDKIPVYFHVDALGRLFITVTSIIWLITGFYAFLYMQHEGDEKRFFIFYVLVYVVIIALESAGNLITFYLFYELMTLTATPLVLHNGSREAIMAALKYLFYSMCGAYSALFGIYFLYQYCDTLNFTAGGTLNMTLVSGNVGILRVAVFMMLIGFGAKAGMFPLHAWLTAAHPAAPAPASAVLSSIIVKGGVLAVIRSVYYIVGSDFIRGTWVQTAWMTLTLLTVLMGSMLAYREQMFKKRLAYSTVSQASYILFGLSLLTTTGMSGALLHFVFHAFIKCALFLTAGIFIFRTGKTKVDLYAGIGKQMKVTLWCYTFASLALIGIPPMSGFISKWYLAQGALQSDTGVFRMLGPVVLLLSALLTAGYLLPITVKGFLPGKDAEIEEKKERIDIMTAALLILTVITIILGIWPNPLIKYVGEIAASL
ncbi:MAG: proton-conducting membrane transporter [Lachnospiraceae bacterium]|nr:proton-conducting membrane transporter [Lachnospiraceae bacterium]